jgi:hypothetical protein
MNAIVDVLKLIDYQEPKIHERVPTDQYSLTRRTRLKGRLQRLKAIKEAVERRTKGYAMTQELV